MGAVRQGRMLPYILLSPLVVFIGALSFVPTVDTTVEAFFRVMPLDPPTRFIGLGNFRALFANPVIITSWVNTAVYVAIGVVASVVLGTAMAVALKQSFRLRGVILALVILPWALPAVVEAVIWSWIYNPTFGVLNSALHSAHAHRRVSRVARARPVADDPADRDRAGLADNAAVRARHPGRAAVDPARTCTRRPGWTALARCRRSGTSRCR